MVTRSTKSTTKAKSTPSTSTSSTPIVEETPDVSDAFVSDADTITGAEIADLTSDVIRVSEPAIAEPDLKKSELVDAVVARSGIKKKDAKPVVEAMMAVLGDAIASGREFNLQPMGKLRINRVEDKNNGRVIICRIRQANVNEVVNDIGPETPLAEAAE